MNAGFFSPRPQPQPHTSSSPTPIMGKGPLARRVHRWVAAVFTLAVAANFAVMPWGPPPAWITYAPLPPLLFLMGTGLVMLASPGIAAALRGGSRNKGAAR
jgi:hypothetical protein